jgi:hypothetical protein
MRIAIRPIPHKIRASSQCQVKMIAHHRIAADIDGENGRKLFEPLANLGVWAPSESDNRIRTTDLADRVFDGAYLPFCDAG